MAKRKTSKSKSKPVTARMARLFKNGRNQAVRIPREWGTAGQTAMVTKDGARLILEPIARKTLADVIAELRRRGPLPPEDRFPTSTAQREGGPRTTRRRGGRPPGPPGPQFRGIDA